MSLCFAITDKAASMPSNADAKRQCCLYLIYIIFFPFCNIRVTVINILIISRILSYFILLYPTFQYSILLMLYFTKKERLTMELKPLKVKVSVTLDENVVENIKKLADEDDRNFSQYVNLILKEWLKSHPAK